MSQINSLGPVVIDVEGKSLSDEDVRVLSNPLVGGLILFTRNYESSEQLIALVGEIRRVRDDIVIAVDHEGGRVQRFRTGFTRIPAMQGFHSLYSDDREESLSLAQDVGWLMASELIAHGVDISFAPVLDVDESFSSIIGDRAFSADPNVVTALAGAFIAGFHEAGMSCTGKHFPGHGSVVADSHLELPVDARELSEIKNKDLIPFEALGASMDAVMPAHILFPKVDSEPVGFSQKWLKSILRQELGFNGVIFSDDLSMEGATAVGSYSDRAVKALTAGCDSVLVCNNRPAVLEVLNSLSECEELSGIDSRLSTMRASQKVSLDELRADPRWASTVSRLSLIS